MNSAMPMRSTANRIFYGPMGLRAGWGILLYLVVVISVIVTSNGIHRHIRNHQRQVQAEAHRLNPQVPLPPQPAPVDPAAPQSMRTPMIVECVALTVLFLLTWFLSRLEHRRFGVYGLGGPCRIWRFFSGAGWGLAAITLLIVTLARFRFLSFDARLLYGSAILYWGLVQLFGFFLVGLAEEYFFRGYLQFTLTRGLLSLGQRLSPSHARTAAFWMAAVVTSAFFGFAHSNNDGETALGLVQLILYALICVLALWRTGSLWWGIGFHMAWDWGQSFVYGVPDSGMLWHGRLFATHAAGSTFYSGGTVGPEGSILVLPLLVLPMLVLYFTHPSPQPPLEQDAALLQTASPALAS